MPELHRGLGMTGRRFVNWLIGFRRSWRVNIHVDDGGCLWADSPTHPEWTGVADSIDELLRLTHEAAAVWRFGRTLCLIDAEAFSHEVRQRQSQGEGNPL